jgi:uncharacterized membrane protein
MEHESDSAVIDWILEAIEYVAVGIEVLAVAVIVIGIVLGTANYLSQRRAIAGRASSERSYRERLGKSLLLGLEILVAADIVRTVALDATLESVGVLGILVVIRTFLSWSIVVEIDGLWPWQRAAGEVGSAGQAHAQSEAGAGNE